MNPINSLGSSSIQQPLAPAKPGVTAADGGDSFKNFLVDSIQNVNAMQQQANRSVESLFTGGDVNPAEVLTAVQKADLAFKMMMQVRNKLVQVYQEVKDVRV
jgi:flagellar hook-basal body complex protein FliE